ncbi:galactokinase [Heterostelium album PN500]|uniref:Galactokinase n=1 Tax=Heterostelium pallidum (strain ATCC 26659 / Pp 5 / PN500) TaxID=670386 RepID=D3B573_HETP5|nr:galactokinase [Heterostelium album PN500]EFA83438.1 galactokinase [Heterostelium album PN500]|eukprot:XP_020435555.1 galactokinase [Heterostelium album PN500]
MDTFNPLVPQVITNVEHIYGDAAANQARYKELVDRFYELYNDRPAFFFRAPGRVNLIGEHVDYSGYPVLPFALQQDTIVAASFNKSNTQLNIANVNNEQFSSNSVDITQPVEIDMSKHHWTNYVLAGWKGVQTSSPNTQFKSLNLLYSGNVPIGSGVSSSSALVCVSTLAFSYMHQLTYTKEDLANISVKCERFVGIEGGGMDQAISYLAEESTAKLIEFNPLRTKNVKLPGGVSFVISNSLVESNKVVTGAFYYNLRVVECRLAAVLLTKKLGLNWTAIRRLIDVQNLSTLTLEQLIAKTSELLQPAAYTRQQVADELEMSVEQLVRDYFPSGIQVTAEHFELQRRALHVFTETLRVYQFAQSCANNESPVDLGQLMNASHFSCAEQFECSCPELDRLTSICRDAGAYGSRLTGAGWGGCVISLVPTDKLAAFTEQIEQQYYSKLNKLPAEKSSYLFSTTPSSGASIVVLPDQHA